MDAHLSETSPNHQILCKCVGEIFKLKAAKMKRYKLQHCCIFWSYERSTCEFWQIAKKCPIKEATKKQQQQQHIHIAREREYSHNTPSLCANNGLILKSNLSNNISITITWQQLSRQEHEKLSYCFCHWHCC